MDSTLAVPAALLKAQGVQLEFSEGARRGFFPDLDTREGREHSRPAIRERIRQFVVGSSASLL